MIDKRTVSTLVAEFLGTGILTLVVLSVRSSAIGIPYFVAIAAGLTVGMAFLASNGYAGAQLNPALTLGLWTIRKVKTVQAVLNIVFQLLGAYAALGLFSYFVSTHMQSLSGKYESKIMVAEAVGAFIFTFGVVAGIYQRYLGAGLAAVGAVAFMLGILVASSASNGFINPALALGVKSWAWGTYVAGPVVGAVIGANLYSLVFAGSSVEATSSTVSSTTTTRSSARTTKPVVSRGRSTRAKRR